ncbi:hypothetical protein ABZ297_46725 [Nonomuraea sp. NPDC005983]|uniref:hypothetical protein n=1 Tax=Nonomuraea sp. NPDC005983 TaxID=3155595 RepID=UPI0033AB1888
MRVLFETLRAVLDAGLRAQGQPDQGVEQLLPDVTAAEERLLAAEFIDSRPKKVDAFSRNGRYSTTRYDISPDKTERD